MCFMGCLSEVWAQWKHRPILSPLPPAEEARFKGIFELEQQTPTTLEEFKKLEAQGANVVLSKHMQRACLAGNLTLVKWLRQKGVSFDPEFDRHGYLGAALQSGNIELIQWLLSEGMILEAENAVSYFGNAAHIKTVKWLMQKRIPLPEGTSERYDILHQHLESGHLEVIQWLIEQKSWQLNPDISTYNSEAYSRPVLLSASKSGNRALMHWLFKQGYLLNNTLLREQALAYAVESRDLDFVKWMYKQGAGINPSNDYVQDLPSGHYVTERWNTNKRGGYPVGALANVAITNIKVTPLLRAIETNQIDTMRWLIENGADTQVKQFNSLMRYGYEHEPLNLMEYACAMDHMELVSTLHDLTFLKPCEHAPDFLFLLPHGYIISPEYNSRILYYENHIFARYPTAAQVYLMEQAVRGENVTLIKYLHAKGVPLTLTGKYGVSLFYTALETRNKNLIAYFLEQGLDIDAKHFNGNSALDSAVENADLNQVKFLLSLGAKVTDSQIECAIKDKSLAALLKTHAERQLMK